MARRVLPSLLLLSCCCVARAEAPADPGEGSMFTEQVVVSANLTPTDPESVGSSVTVIGPEQIAARGASTVADILRTVPGVAVVQAGGPGRNSSVFLRGATSSHTLVLVDGVRVNGPGSGAYDFADLVSDQVESIEVLRGPQSSLYGSEAIGGVISIRTRRARQGEHWGASAEVGNKGSERWRANLESAGEAFDVRLSAARERLPGYSLAAADAHDDSAFPYRNTTLSGLAGLRVGEKGRAEVSMRYLDATSNLDEYDFVTGGYVGAPQYRWQRRTTIAGGSLDLPLNETWHPSLRIGLARDDTRSENPDNPWDNAAFRQQSATATLQTDVRLAAHDTLTVGYTAERRRGDNEGLFNDAVTMHAVFAQDQWSWNDRLFLTGALRNDRHSLFGSKTTYRATAAYRWPSSGTRVHASYGTGFKAPTLNDLFYPGFSNPNLRPETSRGADLGIARTFAGGVVTGDVTLYRSDYDQLIQYDFASMLPQNIARARAQGAEASLTWNASAAIQLDASYTYTKSEDLATGAPLPRRPRHAYGLQVHAAMTSRLSGFVSATAVRDRIEFDGRPMDDYVRVDLTGTYTIAKGLDAILRVQNLAGREYVEVPGYLTPGRLVSFGLSIGY